MQMGWGWALLGAVVLTYIVSRLGLRIAGVGVRQLLLVHTGSYFLLALFSGIVRSGMTLFDTRGLVIYLLPQLLWLTYDWLRLSAKRH